MKTSRPYARSCVVEFHSLPGCTHRLARSAPLIERLEAGQLRGGDGLGRCRRRGGSGSQAIRVREMQLGVEPRVLPRLLPQPLARPLRERAHVHAAPSELLRREHHPAHPRRHRRERAARAGPAAVSPHRRPDHLSPCDGAHSCAYNPWAWRPATRQLADQPATRPARPSSRRMEADHRLVFFHPPPSAACHPEPRGVGGHDAYFRPLCQRLEESPACLRAP